MTHPVLAAFLRLLVLWAITLALALGPAWAQVPETPDRKLDQARSQLDQIAAALTRTTLTDANLQDLRKQLEPTAALLEGVIGELSPRLAAIKSRLDQLMPKPVDKPADKPGEKPADKPASETIAVDNPAAVAERLEQEKSFKETDTTLRRARALQVELDQTADQIQARRRSLFTSALFEQSSSLLRPGLWMDMIKALPRDFRASQVVVGDWAAIVSRQLGGWRLTVFAGLLALLTALIWPVLVVVQRVMSQRADLVEHTRLQRILASLVAAVIVVSIPTAFLFALNLLLSEFELGHSPVQPFVDAVTLSITRMTIVGGLAVALLRPGRADWRVLDVETRLAKKLLQLTLTIAAIISVSKIASGFADVIGAALPLVVVLRGLGALLVAVAIGQGLNTLAKDKYAPVVPQAGAKILSLSGPLRLAAWLLALAITAAVAIGYISFGTFLVEQLVRIGIIAAGLFLLLQLAEEGIPALLGPGTRFGRFLSSTIGIRPESLQQVDILLTGVCQLVLYGLAAVAVVGPWGVQSDDYLESLRTAFFGFKVGDVTISVSSVIFALVVFILALGVTRAVQQWLDVRFLPHTQLDKGLRNSIKTSLGYVGFVVAASLALSNVGLSLERVAFVAGALSVGIGFGLQSIVNNFVSGLILLWEGAIRVGDWIVVGEDQGYVRRINVRSTEIETFERSMVIVPNSNLVSGVVKNWVRGDRIGRVKLVMNLNTGTDVERIREVLIAIAKSHESVIKIPAPSVLFSELNEAGARLELYCFVEEVEQTARVRSDMLFELYKRLGTEGLLPALASNGLNLGQLSLLLANNAKAPS